MLSRTSGRRSWRRVFPIVLMVCFSAATSLVPVRTANAWGFDWFLDLFSGGPNSQIPDRNALISAYIHYYWAAIINTTMFPITLLHALIEGREVSLEDRKRICKETDGTFTSSLEVSACPSGNAVLSPAWDSGLPTQQQFCDRGSGYTYSNVCVYKDSDGSYYWDDGPSIPGTANSALPGNQFYNYIVLFWPAGQWHDYCYHHGQITYGYDKKKCDSRFYSLIFGLCTEDTKLSNTLSWYVAANCVQAAQLAREAVEKYGDSAFSYVSTVVYFEGKYSSPTNPTNKNVSPAIINIINDLLD